MVNTVAKGASKFKAGDKCCICDSKWVEGKRFINHHVDYENDVTKIVCQPCHNWLHASGKIFKHPLKTKFGKDKAPYEFAKGVVRMYKMKHCCDDWVTSGLVTGGEGNPRYLFDAYTGDVWDDKVVRYCPFCGKQLK